MAIEILDFPIKMVIFQFAMLNYQRVTSKVLPLMLYLKGHPNSPSDPKPPGVRETFELKAFYRDHPQRLGSSLVLGKEWN